MKNVVYKILEVVSDELNVRTELLTLETNITDDLGADSLDMVELIICIEEVFGIRISDEETQNINIINDLINIVGGKI